MITMEDSMESRMIKATFLIVLPLFSIFTYAGHNKMNQDSLWQMIKEMKSVWGKQVEDVSKLFNQPLINNTQEKKKTVILQLPLR